MNRRIDFFLRIQPAGYILLKKLIDVLNQDGRYIAKGAVAGMTGEVQLGSFAAEDAKGRRPGFGPRSMVLEVEHVCIEGNGSLHVLASHGRNNIHRMVFMKAQSIQDHTATSSLLYLFRYSMGVSPVIFLKMVRNAFVSV